MHFLSPKCIFFLQIIFCVQIHFLSQNSLSGLESFSSSSFLVLWLSFLTVLFLIQNFLIHHFFPASSSFKCLFLPKLLFEISGVSIDDSNDRRDSFCEFWVEILPFEWTILKGFLVCLTKILKKHQTWVIGPALPTGGSYETCSVRQSVCPSVCPWQKFSYFPPLLFLDFLYQASP